MKKDTKNTDIVIYKLGSASIRIINYRLKVARKKRRKREEMIKRQKIKAIVSKYQKIRKKINLFNKKTKRNYESDNTNKINLNQVNDK